MNSVSALMPKLPMTLFAAFFFSTASPAPSLSGTVRAAQQAAEDATDAGASGLAGIRARALGDAKAGNFPPGTSRDALLLLHAEARDAGWADGAEARIRDVLSTLDRTAMGLDQPSVSCATSVCEIAVLQTLQGAADDATGWQHRFIQLTDEDAWGNGLVETAVVATQGGAAPGRVAYFTYLLFDR